MDIDELFLLRDAGRDQHSDMQPHLRQLRALAAQCNHCTEFGVRTGNSTVALLAGLKDRGGGFLRSYDVNDPHNDFPHISYVDHKFTKADTSKLQEIEPTDLLFIDTVHNAAQVRAELAHARQVRQFIVFHDVIEWGWRPENGAEGILPAIFEFLAQQACFWHVFDLYPSRWGMLVLRRHGS